MEEFLTRHLVDTAASLVANHRFVGVVQVIGTKDSLQQVLLVEWYFHDNLNQAYKAVVRNKG